MTKVRVGINGLGRIGRMVLRAASQRADVEVVAVNDLADSGSLAHLIKYDSHYGRFDQPVRAETDRLVIGSQAINVSSQKDPQRLPWGLLDVGVVIEATGRFRDRESCQKHLEAGAGRVVLSAPPAEATIPQIIIGVNESDLARQSPAIISASSCTTNSVAGIAAICQRRLGVAKSMMTTVHSYTADQMLQDGFHKDWRRARAAAENLVPTKTGAAKAVGSVVSQLAGKFDGLAVRVPVGTVSLTDLTMVLEQKTTVDDLNQLIKDELDGNYYQDLLTYTTDELVSRDFVGQPHSGIVDLNLTQVVDGDLARLVIWYDNQWGYANRLIELAVLVGRAGADKASNLGVQIPVVE